MNKQIKLIAFISLTLCTAMCAFGFTCSPWSSNAYDPWYYTVNVQAGCDSFSYSGSDNTAIASNGGIWSGEVVAWVYDYYSGYDDSSNGPEVLTASSNRASGFSGYASPVYTGFTWCEFITDLFGSYSSGNTNY